uniref:Uncharacterized protein n=1 Tax=Anguilla anguilla TaxID=7936 RepID=A0A0E9SUB8_ANGAN
MKISQILSVLAESQFKHRNGGRRI